jgi:tetratricopeptide (TPR) repeat protein
VAERYGYLFYAGLAVILSVAINDLFQSKLVYSIIIISCFVMSVRTLFRIQDWKDADTLWFSAAPYSYSSFQNHNNLGDAYVNMGDYQKAIEEFTKGIQLNPRYADAMHNRANVYWRLGEMEKAKQGYQDAYNTNPKLWQSLIKIAEIEANQGNWQTSAEIMKKAFQLNPSPEIAGWLKMLEDKAK